MAAVDLARLEGARLLRDHLQECLHLRLVVLQFEVQRVALSEFGLQVLAAADALNLPIHHNRDAVAQRVRLLHQMRRQQERPRLGRRLDDIPQFAPGHGVQAGTGFVHDHHLRIAHERDRHAQTALVAAG